MGCEHRLVLQEHSIFTDLANTLNSGYRGKSPYVKRKIFNFANWNQPRVLASPMVPGFLYWSCKSRISYASVADMDSACSHGKGRIRWNPIVRAYLHKPLQNTGCISSWCTVWRPNGAVDGNERDSQFNFQPHHHRVAPNSGRRLHPTG